MNTIKNKKIHRIVTAITVLYIIFVQQVRFTTIVYGNQIPATPNSLIRNQESNIGHYTDMNGIVYEYNMNDHTATVVGYLGNDIDIIILDSFTVNNDIYTVTTIGNRAFVYLSIRSVTIPDTITTIGDAAFMNNSLTTVTIPDSVITIGNRSFSNNFLTTLTLPNSVITIGLNAFNGNSIQGSVTIPDSVTSLGAGAFYDNQIKEVSISNSVNTIDVATFSYNELESVVIPDSVNTIGDGAFYNNQIRELTIGNSVKTISWDSFSYNQLESIVIPNSVTTIGNSAFSNNQLESVVIPNSVTTIGISVFSQCPLEIIYTDDNHAEALKDLLTPSVMDRIRVETTEIWEGPSHYANHVLLENTVAIGKDIILEAISQIKYVHDNSTAVWNEHLPDVQWYKNDEPIAEANELVLPLHAVEQSDEGIYYAIVDGERLDEIELIIVSSEEIKQPGGIQPSEPENNIIQDPKPKEEDMHETEKINEDISTSDNISGLFLYSSIGILALISMVYTIKKKSKNV